MAKFKGGGSQTRNMLAAAESGSQQRATAAERLGIATERTGQTMMQGGAQVGGALERYDQRETQKEQFDEQMELKGKQHDLNVAVSGMEENPELVKLRQEMEQGAQQGREPLEFTGSRYVPTERTLKKEASAQALAEEKVVTERMRAEGFRDQNRIALAKAQAANDKEAIKQHKANLMKPIESDVNRLNRIMSGKPNVGDWEDLQSEVNAMQGVDPALAQDVQNRQATPRVRDFISRGMAVKVFGFTQDTGDLPEGVDFTLPHMKTFLDTAQTIGGIMQFMGPQFTQWAGITNLGQKTRFVNQLAAWFTMQNLSGQSAAQPSLLSSQQADPDQQAFLDQQREQYPGQSQELYKGQYDPIGPQPWQYQATQAAEQQRTRQAQREVTKRGGPLP